MGESTNMCHSTLNWLNESYLEPVLRKYYKDTSLIITGLDIRPATAKGENYCSTMTRITVDYRLSRCQNPQQGSYIVKTTFEDDAHVANIITAYNIYNTEMIMYEKILPQLTELLQEIGDTDKLFADTLHVDYERSAMIFEDLAVRQFVVADRLAGMDETHAKLALKKLAKMHATAAVLNERMPDVLTKFDRGFFNRHTRGFSPFFEGMIEVCANFAGDCAELGPYYKQKLLRLKPHLVEHATRVFDLKAGQFHTLAHGDFWINNVMLNYKRDEAGDEANTPKQSIKDILIIDFQYCSWTTPSVDLHYFLNNSLENALRFQQQDALVQYYHGILVETLKALKFAGHIPTLHELVVQLESNRFYAVTSSLIVQALMLNDKNDDADFACLLLDDERSRNFRKLLYTNKIVQENAKALLPYFDRLGLLDPTEY